MDDKHKKLKAEKEECFRQIKESNEKLEKIRKECEHPSSTNCLYSWRIGSHEMRNVCDICGMPVDTLEYQIKSWTDGGCSTGLNED